ncbi:MAG: trypsin-like peptidase domain-containing protein [Anaerolineae bacterium]|nr:trypsin-like peptidase domain-containing protein [Chloroflexota bacterium]MBN8634613.1 trypsin-like peptidase domain-containing protein [Anaerolineae bacterium]
MTDVLQNLSNDLAATVEAASRSLVRVEGRRRMAASGIIWSDNGLIVTANHVVERDENIGVGLPNGAVVNASVVGRDHTTDIAILKVQANELTPAAWATDAKVGHLVLAVGRPDAGVQATLGVVSAVGESWRTGAGGMIDQYLQTDVVMYPGFSGGALVTAGGQMLGMNTSGLANGVSLTIPAVTLQRVAQALQAHGRVRRGFLGVSAQPVRLPAPVAAQVQQETGLLLAAVEQGSPADQGGLYLGDTLVALDGQAVRHMDDLMAILSGDRVGKAVTAKIVRGGQVHETSVTIGERQ